MKYIDAEKLKAEIEKRKELLEKCSGHPEVMKRVAGVISAYDSILSFIDSLQQEQPEIDVEKEVSKWWDTFFQEPDFKFKKHRAHIVTNDEIIKLARHFYELGLNARKDKLPEIELDRFTEKIKTLQGRYKHPEIVSIKGAMAFMARLFYQYPNTARQWYEQLPKATMN